MDYTSLEKQLLIQNLRWDIRELILLKEKPLPTDIGVFKSILTSIDEKFLNNSSLSKVTAIFSNESQFFKKLKNIREELLIRIGNPFLNLLKY